MISTLDSLRIRAFTHNPLFFVLPFTAFFLPLSSTLKSVFVALAVVVILRSKMNREQLRSVVSSVWGKALVLFSLVVLLSCFWGSATLSDKWLVLGKYSKLFCLPIFVLGFREERIRYTTIHAFLFAMLLTALLSILTDTGVLQLKGLNADAVFRNHIMTGIMMSFAFFLSGFLFFRTQGVNRLFYLCLGALFSYQVLFISMGRTGYVLYAVMMVMLLIQHFTLRQALMGLLLCGVLFSLSYQFSRPMQIGVQQVVSDLRHYQHDKNTSIGYRIQFHAHARTLFLEHPFIGHGAGGFANSVKQLNLFQSWDQGKRLLEPHSQYWLVASEFGLFGLVCLALLYGSLFFAAYQLNTMRPVAIALLVLILTGNLSDSLLFYSGTGYFFILFMALCLGEAADKTRAY